MGRFRSPRPPQPPGFSPLFGPAEPHARRTRGPGRRRAPRRPARVPAPGPGRAHRGPPDRGRHEDARPPRSTPIRPRRGGPRGAHRVAVAGPSATPESPCRPARLHAERVPNRARRGQPAAGKANCLPSSSTMEIDCNCMRLAPRVRPSGRGPHGDRAGRQGGPLGASAPLRLASDPWRILAVFDPPWPRFPTAWIGLLMKGDRVSRCTDLPTSLTSKSAFHLRTGLGVGREGGAM